MRRIILTVLAATAANLWAGETATPWQFTIKGRDRGIMFVTFQAGTPPTNPATGYGISVDLVGPFTLTGTWDYNSANDITCGFVQAGNFESYSGNFETKSKGNGDLIARSSTTHGPQTFKAPAPGPIDDLSGVWSGSLKTGHSKALQSFTLTPSTNNAPGWYDLTGTAIGESGSFTLSGAVLVTTDRNAAGYTLSNFGTATTQGGYFGRINRKATKLILRGRDEDSQNVTFRAEKPQTN